MYVGLMLVPTAFGQGKKNRRFPLMAGFGSKPDENYLICGVQQMTDDPTEIGDFQFFITNLISVYKQTEAYEPRGSSFGSP